MDGADGAAPAPPNRPGDELKQAAVTLRAMAAPDRPVPVSSFAPFAVAQLLDAVGDALDGDVRLPERVARSALEIARHLRTYGP